MPAIQFAHSLSAGNVPVLRLPGQLGINEADGILYARDTNGNAVPMYAGRLPGTLWGCNTSNNGGSPTTSIDIAPGVVAADTVPYSQMSLTGTLTKNVAVAWAVGSGNGGLDSGSVGNGTYHLFLIRRPDTGVVDAVSSLSPTSPSLPSGYTQQRRIASFARASGANIAYSQNGDEFLLKTPVVDVGTVTINNTTNEYTLSVPTGINAVAMSGLVAFNNDTAFGDMAIWSPDQTFTGATLWIGVQNSTHDASLALVRTNTSAQAFIGTNKNFIVTLVTFGWRDSRGRT
jgi:hypothetical protein